MDLTLDVAEDRRPFVLKPWIKDLAIAVAVTAVLYAVLAQLDAFDKLMVLLREHGDWQLDELILALLLSPATLAWFAWRRLVEARLAVSNLTDLKNTLDRRIVERTAELERSNTVKAEFLATMSHEIRTPLNGVLGMAAMLLESDLMPDQRMQAEEIRNSGESLMTLLNDVLDLSKIEAGKVDLEVIEFNLPELLNSVGALWQPHMRAKNLTFSLDIPASLPAMYQSDPTRIRQIMSNLLGNAVKFTAAGSVTVGVSHRPLDGGRVELRFTVADTGIGIDEAVKPALFSRFTQADSSTSRKYGGSGLGLAICRQIVELMGGQIGVDSTLGQGSTFWFTLPCILGAQQPASNAAADGARGASRRKLHILVAEDNRVNQMVVRAMLERAGHHVRLVGNGAEALAAMHTGEYDLILMDVQMPEMDGVEATRNIRELPDEAGRIPIVALTAHAMKGDREAYLAAGMTDYLSKPLKAKELDAMIARLTARDETASTVVPAS